MAGKGPEVRNINISEGLTSAGPWKEGQMGPSSSYDVGVGPVQKIKTRTLRGQHGSIRPIHFFYSG